MVYELKVYELKNNEFVISRGGAWFPGCYSSREAADYAFSFSYDTLLALQNMKNLTTKVIDFEDLKKINK